MNTEERLIADYAGTGLTVGRHPMHYRRAELHHQHILSAAELKSRNDGEHVRTAGCIIARQRPGTAKGSIFLSLEDETGIANVIITPDLYERERILVTRCKFLMAEGPLQNQDGVIHVKACVSWLFLTVLWNFAPTTSTKFSIPSGIFHIAFIPY
jgi:error-prone DNA polymerase